MALTQSRSDPPVRARPGATDPRPTGVGGVLGSGDHKVVGRLLIGASLLYLLASLVTGLLVDLDQRRPGHHKLGSLLNDGNVLQFVSSHITGEVFAGLVPLFLGLALVVVPLQIGARAVAFPRAAAAGFWAWLLGAVLVTAAYGIGGSPYGSRAEAFDLWALGFVLALAGLVLLTVCVVTTVFTLRAPGMRLTRVPLFAWGMVAAGTVWILTLPVLAALLLVVYVDHHNGGIFTGAGTDRSFSQVLWALRAPTLYAFVAPALGIIGDIVPTIAKARNDYRHQVAQGLIGAFAILGFGAYTVTSVAQPDSTTVTFSNPVVLVACGLIVLPVLALAGLWADTFRRGRANGKPAVGSPLAFVGVTVPLLLLAVLLGALPAIERLKLHDTLFVDGHFELVVGAGLAGALAGLHYWSTKIVGRQLLDAGGFAVATLVLVGTIGMAAGQMIPGAFGNNAEQISGTTLYNSITALGAGALTLAVLLALVNVLASLRGGESPADPYEGLTLEWATSSPPAYDNFTEVPPVGSEAPLSDLRNPEVVG